MSLSIEERYDEVRQLITVGKEKGYLLYDEVNELLPSEITSSEELDDLFNAFGSAGIEVVDSDKAYRGEKDFDRDGSEEGPELDLTPGALDKTNDPVRMYLREMGTVPLLTREGEVAIAKRIERGKRIMLAQITRTPIAAGEQLEASRIGVKELVIFVEEEITEEKLERKKRETLKLVGNVKAAFDGYLTLKAKYEDTARKDPKWVRGKWRVGRQRVGFSKAIRRLELTENVKRRLLDRLREAVDRVSQLEEQVTRMVVKSEGRLSEEQKKVIKRDIQE